MQVALVTDTFPPDLNGVDGKVAFGDQAAFAARLAEASVLPAARRAAVGAAGRRSAESLDWDRVIRRFEEILIAVSASQNPPSTPLSPHAFAP